MAKLYIRFEAAEQKQLCRAEPLPPALALVTPTPRWSERKKPLTVLRTVLNAWEAGNGKEQNLVGAGERRAISGK